jgi:hypothetical protein
MKHTTKKGTSLGTILTIGLAGAAIGAMFIPYRRNEIRSKVVTGAQDLADFVTEKLKFTADEIVSRTEKLFENKKSQLDNVADEAKKEWDKNKSGTTGSDFKI